MTEELTTEELTWQNLEIRVVKGWAYIPHHTLLSENVVGFVEIFGNSFRLVDYLQDMRLQHLKVKKG